MAVVRVVAGSARGRRLVAPEGDRVRPTTDRVREAVCNALGSMGAIEGSRVLDLFAGSGALGIEAMSRGAASVTFVEPDRSVRDVLAANLATTGFADVDIVASTAQRHLRTCDPDTYDLVFADPPYAFDEWGELFVALGAATGPDVVVVVESDRSIGPAPGWVVFKHKRYGSTVVDIHVRAETPPSEHGAEL